ncbi:hypothetical protein [Cruoricaptor ignavus]|nr:hypothetical protein [Cruoricaptor ignavus]
MYALHEKSYDEVETENRLLINSENSSQKFIQPEFRFQNED